MVVVMIVVVMVMFDGGDDGDTCKACDADCILDFTSSKSNNIFIDSDVFCST